VVLYGLQQFLGRALRFIEVCRSQAGLCEVGAELEILWRKRHSFENCSSLRRRARQLVLKRS
jgi:hypothetical protein